MWGRESCACLCSPHCHTPSPLLFLGAGIHNPGADFTAKQLGQGPTGVWGLLLLLWDLKVTITILASWFVVFFFILKKLKGGCESVRKQKKKNIRERGRKWGGCLCSTYRATLKNSEASKYHKHDPCCGQLHVRALCPRVSNQISTVGWYSTALPPGDSGWKKREGKKKKKKK